MKNNGKKKQIKTKHQTKWIGMFFFGVKNQVQGMFNHQMFVNACNKMNAIKTKWRKKNIVVSQKLPSL